MKKKDDMCCEDLTKEIEKHHIAYQKEREIYIVVVTSIIDTPKKIFKKPYSVWKRIM